MTPFVRLTENVAMLRTLGFVFLAVGNTLSGQVDVLTAQYNNSRTSSNTQETILTQANVNGVQFGKLFSRSVDAPFYASPLILSNLNVPGVGTRNVVYVATLGNTIYAFDADNPAVSAPYWSVHLGTTIPKSTWYGPSFGILSTPVIDRSTNTIYLTAIVDNGGDVGLYLYALELTTGAFKFNSPRRISYTFSTGVTVTSARLNINSDSWLQRAGLLLVNGILYVGTSNVWPGDTHLEQQGFIQAFQANNLSVQLGSFEASPGGKGGFWQAGRGIAADASGNVFAAINGSSYNPPWSFGDSVVKFGAGGVTPVSWFTPSNWNLLYQQNLDMSASGVTLIPGTNLAFAAGKIGILYLLNQSNLGGLESAGGPPLQQFRASQGCGTQQCGQHLATAFWPHATNPKLYVWDVFDSLRAYPFDWASQRFAVSGATVGSLRPSRAGGISVTSNSSQAGTGIAWVLTAAQNPIEAVVPGTLRAYSADDITQELYNSDKNSCRDAMGSFMKFSTPIVANGKVYVNTQSNSLRVYGLLPASTPTVPEPGKVLVTVRASMEGLNVSVDGAAPCSGTREFQWDPGSSHTLSTVSPQSANPGDATHAGTPESRYVFAGWSDGGAISHSVAPVANTTYTANFVMQHFLATSVAPEGSGGIATTPSSSAGYFNAGETVQLTATPAPGCTFSNWSGAVSGASPSQAITISGPHSVTANFICANPSAPLITGYTHRVLRNDFTGWVGTKFTVGAEPITALALGRIAIFGNTGQRIVKLVKASDGTDVPGGSAVVPLADAPGGSIRYIPLASAVTLQANTAYYLVTRESAGGDEWYDLAPVSAANAVTVNSAIYSSNGVNWLTQGAGSWSYGPLNLVYSMGASVPPPPPDPLPPGPPPPGTSFLTGYALSGSSLRNNFSGWVGMRLTIGSSALTVTSVGRVCVAGNSGIHTVKFVNPATRADIPGGSAQVNMAGCLPGQFTYAPLTAPLTLNAGANYYLASQEFQGGDRWHDQSRVSSTNVAAVAQGVYSYDSAAWTPIGVASTSYVPPNFLYTAGVPTPPPPPPPPPEPPPPPLPPPPSQAGFITGFALNSPTLRNNFSGWVGMKITVVDGLDIESIGRICIAGNAGTHTVKFVNTNTGADVGAASINLAGCTPGQFVYSPVAPFSLLPGVSYYLVSQETSGGDRWYDIGAVSSTAFAAVNSAVYSANGSNWTVAGGSNTSYVPVSFQYIPGVPDPNPPLITGFNNSALRRNFTGWVGTKLTIGAAGRTVNSLGRLCAVGNGGMHAVKLVQASNGIDVPGGSATVNMASCTPGQFVYAALGSPIVLAAGTSYYLVSQETSGGDQWYDLTSVTARPSITFNSGVYSSGLSWITIGGLNMSYVAPNLK